MKTRSQSDTAPVAVVGYCYGGRLAWLAAHALPVAAAVGYYGRQVHQFIELGRRVVQGAAGPSH